METTKLIMEKILNLHPAAQVVAIISIAAVVCVFIYQFFKTLRDS